MKAFYSVNTYIYTHTYMVKPNIWRVPVPYSQRFGSIYVGYDHSESLILMVIMCLNIPKNTVPDSQRYWSPSTQSQHISKAGWHALSQSETEADEFSARLDSISFGNSLSHSHTEIMSLQPGQVQSFQSTSHSLQVCDPVSGLSTFPGPNSLIFIFVLSS